jgi:hypothetical protein
MHVDVGEVKKVLVAARSHLRTNGVRDTVTTVWDFVTSPIAFRLSPWLDDPGSFTLDGLTYQYVRALYPNRPWRNERAVELALAKDFVDRRRETRTLEVGNVVSQYVDFPHDIVDKYERAVSVRNIDIVDLAGVEAYESLLSVSTLEHVGWDERPRQAGQVEKAYRVMRSSLQSGGEMLLTCPLGYNHELDALVAADALDFPSRHFLIRVSKDNRWEEADKGEALGRPYGSAYRNANALFVGRVVGSSRHSSQAGGS